MIQVQFTDEGKLHTVTFSGEDAEKWAAKFTDVLDYGLIGYSVRHIGQI